MAITGSVTTVFNRIPQVIAGLHFGAETAVADTAEVVASGAQSRAPVDTGALRASISVSGSGTTREVTTGVDYAIFQEFGTVNMPAHPFLIPAAEAERGRWLARFGNLLT